MQAIVTMFYNFIGGIIVFFEPNAMDNFFLGKFVLGKIFGNK